MMATSIQPVMTASAVEAYLEAVFPQVSADGKVFTVTAVGPMRADLRMAYSERLLRPGGTISGPAMFTLADLALYVTILAHVGEEALAVTTNINLNFLRKPAPAAMIGRCTLLKLGKRLAVGEVGLYSEGQDEMVAHAMGTYSIPPR
ncbi:MAG: PaaI family thioesterase [Pseudomonadota bacterium]